MTIPMLPPEYHVELNRELNRAFRSGAHSRHRRRHPSSLDWHELGYEHEASRPDLVWMALRRVGERVGRLTLVQRFSARREERAEREVDQPAPAAPDASVSATGTGTFASDTGRPARRC